MMVTNGGQLIRMPTTNIRYVGRQTQGVTLFKIGKDEDVVSVARIFMEDEDEDELEASANVGQDTAEGEETIANDSAEEASSTDVEEAE